MRIKQATKQTLIRKILNYLLALLKNYKIIQGILVFGLCVGLLFSIKLFWSTGFANRIKKHLSLKSLKIPLNYLSGFLVEPERITIDIKYEDYQKLAYNRAVALKRKYLLSDGKDWIPATIRYNNEIFRVKKQIIIITIIY